MLEEHVTKIAIDPWARSISLATEWFTVFGFAPTVIMTPKELKP